MSRGSDSAPVDTPSLSHPGIPQGVREVNRPRSSPFPSSEFKTTGPTPPDRRGLLS